MKRYLLSIYQPAPEHSDPDALERIMRDLEVLNADLKSAGAWVFAGGLHAPDTATVVRVRVREGEVLTTDGPFAEGKEHLGGFNVIEAEDLDAALEWARRLAEATTLPIEVRPFRH